MSMAAPVIFPAIEMRGGQLIIDGDATRPCANMKDGTCVILGRVHEMIPTFEKIDRRLIPEWNITADVYRGTSRTGEKVP